MQEPASLGCVCGTVVLFLLCILNFLAAFGFARQWPSAPEVSGMLEYFNPGLLGVGVGMGGYREEEFVELTSTQVLFNPCFCGYVIPTNDQNLCPNTGISSSALK